MRSARELAATNRHHGPDASEMQGGAAAGNGAHSAHEDTLLDLSDGLPLSAKAGVSLREPKALDAHTDLRRERQEALRRGPTVEPDTDGDQFQDHPAHDPPPGPRGRGFFGRRPLRMVAVVLLVSLVVAFGIPLWHYLESYEATDNAQIDGHIDLVSSRIDGTVVHVYAENNQTVRAGELLIAIDPRDYEVAVETMRANLTQAEAQVKAAQADYETALSKLHASEATSAKAQRDAARYEELLKEEVASRVQYEEYLRVAQVAGATVGADRATVTSAHNTIASRKAAVQAAKAALDQGLLNLSYTRIYAPAGGIVGKKTVELGQRIQPGQTLMAVVETEDIWVTANFKETQLANVRRGQHVTIHVDTFGRDYRGYVENLPGASGDRFSLLPPENATGNYVKVVQRLPVRIQFAPGQDPEHLLRPGMSVEPTVWLR